MNQLTKFLLEVNTACEIYREKIDERLNVCLGNVSCDMDSAVGAILLAYYLTNKNEYYKDYGNYEIFWVPVINCPREELNARIDIHHHFKAYNIDIKNLVYIDDIDLNYYSSNNLLNLALIDHNKLDYSQQAWDNSVTFVVDHHVDLHAYQSARKIIEFCGSACSMVINLIFEDKLEEILTKEICQFFSSAILIDTENFKPSLKGTKWSDVDENAFMRLNRTIFQDYYNELIGLKTDRKANIELGLDLILKKDYKNYIWKDIVAGIAVCFNSLHDIMQHFGVENLKQKIKERMIANNLNIFCMITQIYLKTGEAFREIMIFDLDPQRLNKVSELFEKKCPYSLQKKKFTGLKGNFTFFYFKDESVSRKKVEPILKDIFENL